MTNDTLTILGDANRFIDGDFDKKVPILTCMSGEQVGRRIMLADDHITLGRSPDATIMLQDTHVSRLHLTIQYDAAGGKYRIKDLGSSNGTLLNETRITEAELRDGDKIIIGHTLLRFSWADALDQRFQNEIEHLMNIDQLTGLVVKRRFDEELNRFAAVARKQGSALAMMMMDMDGIKGINDTHGHPFGAFAIAETGRIVKRLIGDKGLASRFGGDEFMAFIPNATVEAARGIGEEIRKSVEDHTFVKDDIVLKPTICIGISVLKPGDTLETLLKRADEALYQSKRRGRNRVSVSD
jgi:two-component system, cell cycle response regulator